MILVKIENLEAKNPLRAGWRLVRLDEICVINPSRPMGLKRKADALTTFIPMSAIDQVKGIISKPELRPFAEIANGYTYFGENDVLFAKITPCMQNGKHAIATGLTDGIGFGTTEFHVIRPQAEIIPEWIHLFLRQTRILSAAANHFTGAVGQQRVPESFLASLEIPLPPLAEQERVAHILNEQMAIVEKARSDAEARLEAAKALTAAYLREVFPKPGQELPKGWKWVQLGDIFDVKQGVAMSPTRRKGIALHPFLRTLNIQWGYVDLSNLDKMDFNDDEVTNLKLRNGDLLVCEGGDVGRTAIWKGELDDCLYQNHIHRLRQKDNLVISDFYVYWLQIAFLVFHSYKGKNSTTTIPNLSGGQLKSFLVPLPPKIEQNQIVLRLNEKMGQAQYLVKTIQSEFEFINALPAVLLHRAFTGGL